MPASCGVLPEFPPVAVEPPWPETVPLSELWPASLPPVLVALPSPMASFALFDVEFPHAASIMAAETRND